MRTLDKELLEQMGKFSAANRPEFSTALSFHSTAIRILVNIFERNIAKTIPQLSISRAYVPYPILT